MSALLAALAGFGVGAAVLTKWLPALTVFFVWALYIPWKEPWRRPVCHLLAGLFICGAATVVSLAKRTLGAPFPRRCRSKHNTRLSILSVPLDGHSGPPLYQLARIPDIYLARWPLWLRGRISRAQRLARYCAGRALTAWFVIPYAFFAFVKTKMPYYVAFARAGGRADDCLGRDDARPPVAGPFTWSMAQGCPGHLYGRSPLAAACSDCVGMGAAFCGARREERATRVLRRRLGGVPVAADRALQ